MVLVGHVDFVVELVGVLVGLEDGGELVLFEGDVIVVVTEGFVYELVVEAEELGVVSLLLVGDGLAHLFEFFFGAGLSVGLDRGRGH